LAYACPFRRSLSLVLSRNARNVGDHKNNIYETKTLIECLHAVFIIITRGMESAPLRSRPFPSAFYYIILLRDIIIKRNTSINVKIKILL
jgi:hypothetical protein